MLPSSSEPSQAREREQEEEEEEEATTPPDAYLVPVSKLEWLEEKLAGERAARKRLEGEVAKLKEALQRCRCHF
jgi:hypothetical protein